MDRHLYYVRAHIFTVNEDRSKRTIGKLDIGANNGTFHIGFSQGTMVEETELTAALAWARANIVPGSFGQDGYFMEFEIKEMYHY